VPPESSLEDHVQAVTTGRRRGHPDHADDQDVKIGVDLDMTGKRPMDAKTTLPRTKPRSARSQKLTPLEMRLCGSSRDITLEPAPYAAMATRIVDRRRHDPPRWPIPSSATGSRAVAPSCTTAKPASLRTR